MHDVIANAFTYLDADTVIHGTEGQHCNNKWVARKCPKNFAPRLLFLVIYPVPFVGATAPIIVCD